MLFPGIYNNSSHHDAASGRVACAPYAGVIGADLISARGERGALPHPKRLRQAEKARQLLSGSRETVQADYRGAQARQCGLPAEGVFLCPSSAPEGEGIWVQKSPSRTGRWKTPEPQGFSGPLAECPWRFGSWFYRFYDWRKK